MAFSQSLPLSEIIKAKDVDEPKKKTREDWRKAKELEEARKAGTAPAAVDEEGKDINPHIPQYISQAPWYFGGAGPTLKHQRPQPEKQKEFARLDDWYQRGFKGPAATRYRKGACENCGAMTHKKKDCLERPRKIGARFTGALIAPDEVLHGDIPLDYDGKRDRWNGYDPAQHKSIIEEYRKVEEAKRELKAEKMKQDVISGDGLGEQARDSDADEDEDKYVDDVDMPGTKVDSKQRITVRNLRIREDTAKYLRNLDPNSAYYDPKTRAMRDNPLKNIGKNEEEVQYAGDNFVRYTGDTVKHAQAQMFAWEAYERGVDVHLLAEPTKLELLNKEFDKRKDQFKYTVKDKILDKYGGEEHLEVPPKELLLAQSEDYVEYSRHGKVIKGEEKPVIRSKYEEDVYINNHTSVWGSYYVHGWVKGNWGYRCCHSLVKNSYCTGEAGKAANAQAIEPAEEEQSEHSEEEEEVKTLMQIHKEMRKAVKETDEDDEETKKDKLSKALEEEEKHQRKADKLLGMDERKRPYNSMYDVKAPSDEQMEAYYMKKRRDDDPMADFL